MSGRFALDTNIVIALIDGDLTVRDHVIAAGEIFIPSPVIGELYFGAYCSDHADSNVARIDDLARWYGILPIDDATAKIRIDKVRAKSQGKANSRKRHLDSRYSPAVGNHGCNPRRSFRGDRRSCH